MTEILGFKLVRRDLTTERGGRAMRYLPGAVIRSDHDVVLLNRSGCPERPGDGVCVAHTIQGAQSGGARCEVMVLVAYDPADILGSQEDGAKVRVRQLRVLDEIIDVHRWLRRYGAYANLTGADLTRADLTRANLTGANLTYADLTYADLTRTDLYGTDLYGANLTGANLTRTDLYGASANQWTRWPQGFDPAAAGVNIR